MKRKISWKINCLPPKNRNFSMKIRKEIIIGVDEDEVKQDKREEEMEQEENK